MVNHIDSNKYDTDYILGSDDCDGWVCDIAAKGGIKMDDHLFPANTFLANSGHADETLSLNENQDSPSGASSLWIINVKVEMETAQEAVARRTWRSGWASTNAGQMQALMEWRLFSAKNGWYARLLTSPTEFYAHSQVQKFLAESMMAMEAAKARNAIVD